jgi:hypothetical protein
LDNSPAISLDSPSSHMYQSSIARCGFSSRLERWYDPSGPNSVGKQKTKKFMVKMLLRVSGWWFGTFFIFPYIGNNHPKWLIFFKMVKTNNKVSIWPMSGLCSSRPKSWLHW